MDACDADEPTESESGPFDRVGCPELDEEV